MVGGRRPLPYPTLAIDRIEVASACPPACPPARLPALLPSPQPPLPFPRPPQVAHYLVLAQLDEGLRAEITNNIHSLQVRDSPTGSPLRR